MATRATLHTLVLDALLQVSRDNNADGNDALVPAVAPIAVARAFELWNQQSSSILRLLPPELMAECFGWFDDIDWYCDLRAVTATSRRFRAIALSAPALWARIAAEDFRHGLKAIALMLERSMHAPLQIGFPSYTWSASEEVEVDTFLTRNIYRAHTISICSSRHLDQILRTFTPILRRLRVHWLPTRLLVRQSDWAPQLQHIELHGPFEVPIPRNPFRFLTHFLGYMEWHGVISDARRLFQLCPQLESMLLFEITRDTLPLLPVGPVPASLLSLELSCPHYRPGNTDDCDLSTFASMWHGRHLRNFQLNCARALLILLQHLHSLRLRPLSLDVDRGDRLARVVVDNGVEYSVALRENESLDSSDWDLIAPYLCDLTTLTTLDLPCVLSAALSLPSLQEIIWDTTWGGFEPVLEHARMPVPRLHTLRILTRAFGDSDLELSARHLPDMVLDHLLIDGQRNKVPRIVILDETMEYVRSIEWMRFMRGTRALYVGEELLWEEP
ncbi:hypothetical protein EXIGLDRAFT_839779 [Exidia glandulosa HHB12029]|uniref:Uncharacterized protein n=1 Tax=Exidia glandulosa HHB12029 TaxID=1314781 RepID=A0A165ETX6_EXIGL|nr:hypothetical protein EXIGLDRAFT_839779 [Exidia glandulosa HHB12029]